jgi:hypothetical protein
VDSLPLAGIFPERKYIPLLEALATVDNAAGFLDEFGYYCPSPEIVKSK